MIGVKIEVGSSLGSLCVLGLGPEQGLALGSALGLGLGSSLGLGPGVGLWLGLVGVRARLWLALGAGLWGARRGTQTQPPRSLPRTLSKRSSTRRTHRWRCRMTGLSQLSFSSSSRSGPCPVGLQAWAKPTPWAPWVRAGPRQGGVRSRSGARRAPAPVLSPRHASSMRSFPLALGSPGRGGTRGNMSKLSCHKKEAEKHLSFLWNGVVSLETR